jgi:hypothetical protein
MLVQHRTKRQIILYVAEGWVRCTRYQLIKKYYCTELDIRPTSIVRTPKYYAWLLCCNITVGRAVAQAVSRWLPTAAPRVRVRAACGVFAEQSGTGSGFLRVLRFPRLIIPPVSPTSQSPGAGTIGLLVVAVPSGPNHTPPPTIPIKRNTTVSGYAYNRYRSTATRSLTDLHWW